MEITLPYHLITPALLSIIAVGWIIFFKFRRPEINRRFWISAIIYLVIYGAIVALAAYDDINKQQMLNQFDLDKDGYFVDKEITPQQEQAEQALINDAGRNFSIITAFFPAIILATGSYVIMILLKWVKRNKHI